MRGIAVHKNRYSFLAHYRVMALDYFFIFFVCCQMMSSFEKQFYLHKSRMIDDGLSEVEIGYTLDFPFLTPGTNPCTLSTCCF